MRQKFSMMEQGAITQRAVELVKKVNEILASGYADDWEAERTHLDEIRDTLEWVLDPKSIDHPLTDTLEAYQEHLKEKKGGESHGGSLTDTLEAYQEHLKEKKGGESHGG